MTAETFSPGTKGIIITNLVKLIRREQVEMVANEHLKCTATLPYK